MNLLEKLSRWYLTRAVNKQKKKNLSEQDKKNLEVYKEFQKLYAFVKEVNTKIIQNRAQRKEFWRKVQNGEPLVENTIQRVIDHYAKLLKKDK